MNSRRKFIIAFLTLCFAVLFITSRVNPKTVRVQQHLTYNTDVKDTSLSIDQETFSSHLPVVSIDTGGAVIPGKPQSGQRVREIKNSFVLSHISIWEKEGKLNSLQKKADLEIQANIRIRGNSSRTFDKVGYLLKFVDSDGNDKEKPVMGMESNSSWILHGPYLDKSLMRNYMWYNLSGQIMEWAPDVRFCEVFLNGKYQGIYVMTEQIGMGEGRIAIQKFDGKSDVTSYIVCADRESVNDVSYLDNFTSYAKRTNSKLEIKYPGAKKLTPDVVEYISKDFSKFEKSLYSFDYDTELYGYENYIDAENFAEYFLINEITQNIDAGSYSTYFYKDVRGKIKMCVWDFNNCCDNYIEEEQSLAGFYMHDRPWFYMLSKDEKFMETVIDKYRELRNGILSDEAVKDYISSVRAYLGSAIDRNFIVWGYSFEEDKDLLAEGRKIGSYEEAVEQYEGRLLRRLGWLDKHIDTLRSYSHESVNKKFNH